MPLKPFHHEFIATILEDLIILPTNGIQLILEARKIKFVLDKDNPCNADHPYSRLRECLFHPTIFLRRLEDMNKADTFTIGEVQIAIIDFITSKLEQCAIETHLPFLNLAWNKTEVLNKIKPAQNTAIFESEAITIESGPSPWELKPRNNVMFARVLHVKEVEKKEDTANSSKLYAFVEIYAYLNKERVVYRTINLGELADDFDNDFEEAEYIEDLKQHADDRAENWAFRMAKKYLTELYPLLDQETLEKAHPKIVTHKLYFHNMKLSFFNCKKLMTLSETEIENLTDESIIDLITHQHCTVSQAKRLSPTEKNLITHHLYHKMIKQKKITVADIKNVDTARVHFYILPTVTNLIQKELISFDDVRKFPIELKPIFFHPSYYSFLTKQKDHWPEFYQLTPALCKLLQEKWMMQLIVNDIISIEQLKNLETPLMRKIKNPTLQFLLLNHLIPFPAVKAFPKEITTLLTKDPKLQTWWKSDLVNLKLLLDKSLSDVYIHVFSNRLFKIQAGEPALILGKTDSLQLLQDDLNELLQKHKSMNKELPNMILQQALQKIKDDLDTQKINSDESAREYYDRLTGMITDDLYKIKFDFTETFANLLAEAKCIFKELTRNKYLSHEPNAKKADESWFFFLRKKRPKVNSQKQLEHLEYRCRNILTLEAVSSSFANEEQKKLQGIKNL